MQEFEYRLEKEDYKNWIPWNRQRAIWFFLYRPS